MKERAVFGRLTVAVLVLVACCSCTPARHHPETSTVSVPVPAADRRLLQQLALADPTGPAPIVPARAPAAAAPPFQAAAAASVDDEQRATDCLSAAVYYEARSEPLDGQRAVAQVVLNRVRDRAFPASVCRVVYQRSSAGCQFSFACDGSTGHPIEPRAWTTAAAVARAALGGSVYAPVGSATHYHTTAILPWWAPSLARIGTIGSHIFYRWGNRLGSALSFRQSWSGHEVGSVATASVGRGPNQDVAATTTFGITVHRGMASAAPVAAAPVAAAPVVAAPVVAAAFGVRIHRGVPRAAVEPATAEAATAN